VLELGLLAVAELGPEQLAMAEPRQLAVAEQLVEDLGLQVLALLF
jgi:hypothetical protein